MVKFKSGENFIKEKLGSATMVNVDGQFNQDFADGPTKEPNKDPENKM